MSAHKYRSASAYVFVHMIYAHMDIVQELDNAFDIPRPQLDLILSAANQTLR